MGYKMLKRQVIFLMNKLALYFCKGEFFFEVVKRNCFLNAYF